jgi:hypothetical protein
MNFILYPNLYRNLNLIKISTIINVIFQTIFVLAV